MRAYCLIRDKPFYRKEAFVSGLRKCGYEVSQHVPSKVSPGDVLVIWNRYGSNHQTALAFEKSGGTVLVAENGYINSDGSSPKFSVHPGGPKSSDYYAIGLGFHNDYKRIPSGVEDRWSALGLEIKPWRKDGEHILVCPNRSFGIPGRMMSQDWAESAARQIKILTKRPVRIRAHPGNDAPVKPLQEDLKDAWAVFIWSSSSGVHALLEGIPVYVAAPYWIMREASATGLLDDPVMPDRLHHFQRMAWGQWTVSEISKGLPFGHMLSAAR